jgi:hypothetical protein
VYLLVVEQLQGGLDVLHPRVPVRTWGQLGRLDALDRLQGDLTGVDLCAQIEQAWCPGQGAHQVCDLGELCVADRREGVPYGFGQGKRGALGRGAGQHGGMADLLWDDVSSFFDPDLMGSLPDVRVPNASVEDWQAVLDLVQEKGWKCQYSEGEMVLPVPRAEAVLSRPTDAECPDLRVWPTADVLAIFRFRADDEVDFDVDLWELQGQDRLDVFCGLLREIGRRLGKPVQMDPEGDCGHPVLGFDVEADRVVLLADPQVR